MTSDVSAWLEDLTWPEAKACFDKGMPAVIAIGAATNAPGLHLPIKTDAMTARALVQALIERLPMIAAPVVSVGLPLPIAICRAMVSELVVNLRSYAVRRIVILNVGESTRATVDEIASGLDDLLVLHPPLLDAEDQTSVVLALDPRSVRMERLDAAGDAARATAYKGERLLAARADDMVGTITNRWPELAPARRSF